MTGGAGRGSVEPGAPAQACYCSVLLFCPWKGWTTSPPSVDLGMRALGVKAPLPSSLPESSLPGPSPWSSLLCSSLCGSSSCTTPPFSCLVGQAWGAQGGGLGGQHHDREPRESPSCQLCYVEEEGDRPSLGFPHGDATPTPSRFPGWGLAIAAASRECPMRGGRQSFSLGEPEPHLPLGEISQEH